VLEVVAVYRRDRTEDVFNGPTESKEEYVIRLFHKIVQSSHGFKPGKIDVEFSESTRTRIHRELRDNGIIKRYYGDKYQLGENGEQVKELICPSGGDSADD
jgi:hypothetical protein